MGGVVFSALQSYLQDRIQVVVPHTVSCLLTIWPTGLGLLLFLLLVNNFSRLDEALLYAHDKLLITGGATIVGEIERAAEDLAATEHCFKITRFQFNKYRHRGAAVQTTQVKLLGFLITLMKIAKGCRGSFSSCGD